MLRGSFVQLVSDAPWDFKDEGLQAFGDLMSQPLPMANLHDSFEKFKTVCTNRAMILLDKQLGKSLGPLLGNKEVANAIKQASAGTTMSLSAGGEG